MTVVNRNSAPHYKWGQGCDGWFLASSNDLLVIQERMPASSAERRHYHSKARQFFFVLQGQLTMELDGVVYDVPMMSGIEVAPNRPHQARNEGETEVEFLEPDPKLS